MDDLVANLTILAEKLNTTPDHLKEVLYKQLQLDLITYGLITLAYIYIIWFVGRKQYKFWIKMADDNYDKTEEDFVVCIFYLLFDLGMLFCSVYVLSNVHWAVSALYNPEYASLEYILKWINK